MIERFTVNFDEHKLGREVSLFEVISQVDPAHQGLGFAVQHVNVTETGREKSSIQSCKTYFLFCVHTIQCPCVFYGESFGCGIILDFASVQAGHSGLVPL